MKELIASGTTMFNTDCGDVHADLSNVLFA
jgi:hypothetical protein